MLFSFRYILTNVNIPAEIDKPENIEFDKETISVKLKARKITNNKLNMLKNLTRLLRFIIKFFEAFSSRPEKVHYSKLVYSPGKLGANQVRSLDPLPYAGNLQDRGLRKK